MLTVTQVIQPWSDFSRVPQHKLDEAIKRGVAVHRSCAAYASKLWSPPLADCYHGYFNSFKRWFDTTVVEVIAVEPEIVHPIYGYAGHPDLIARLKGDNCNSLIDYKTPAAQANKAWRTQLAGYDDATNKMSIYSTKRVLALRLTKNGGMPIINEYTNTLASDFSVFLSCLHAYRFFKGE